MNRKFLLLRRAFLKGVARTLDIGGVYQNLSEKYISRNPQESDLNAISSDWKAVGNDFTFALKDYKNGFKKERERFSHSK